MSTEQSIHTTSTAELKAMLNDSVEIIDEIRAELDAREAQAQELEKMDSLIIEARPKLQEIRGFFALVLDELRTRRG
ncbi:hypothetical protein B0H98_11124 [Vreelandella songnenensis]|uniref:Uncharacterized protein n=1 Tax=Vreelandella songnenensis TaxID=1176243 RepID=A0A2T0UUQ1_9GAMM|nr:hypothetical protein [Halomonas songnenensis]PRY61624.1 hypothetical protein B0H98_11124 [Halomonas songnenensis]